MSSERKRRPCDFTFWVRYVSLSSACLLTPSSNVFHCLPAITSRAKCQTSLFCDADSLVLLFPVFCPCSIRTPGITCTITSGLMLSWTMWPVYTWKSTYEGEMAFGRMNGRGSYRTSVGSRYDGYFLEDLREGHGDFFTRDSSTIWSGNWEHGEFTGSANRMIVKRRDIFNKRASGRLPSIAEAIYTGFTVNGLISGGGKVEFYTEEPNRRMLFALQAQFQEGSINQPTGYIPITWGESLPSSSPSPNAVLQNWTSSWSYGAQTVSGIIVFPEEELAFSFANGEVQEVDMSDHLRSVPLERSSLDKKKQELELVKAVIEAVRAFEWHFIFHRLQLAPLDSFINQDALDRNFEGHINYSHGEKQEL